MKAILYVGHGTRVQKGKEEVIQFVKGIEPRIDVPLQEICFLEISSPSMEEGVASLVKQGATKISVVPLLLLSATHAYYDIPLVIHSLQQHYPTVTFSYGRPIGVQERIIDVLEERLNQVEQNTKALVLLVGRGSYHPETKVDINRIADKLRRRVSFQIRTCFLAAIKPSFEDALAEASSRNTSIIVLPYLWFDGLLIRSMQEEMAPLSHKGIMLCSPLGDHPIMKQAVVDRVRESWSFPFIHDESQNLMFSSKKLQPIEE
ncbi:sirohydrochlorin chelatase [Radiobacillus kanasensis]|uniref:sirohydrochlorin chelatase n=1 Tax=Radiobacillus kanasensis TaxID=2844358 RepID=UPI001E572AD7|nr:sirohydrochlorin chelatase [Radiobacillus kanasensis]UFT98044.1 sirohydrochlorin chelatase [Radiobacillus kanasensis]